MVKKINVSEIEAQEYNTIWPNGTLILDSNNKLKVFDGSNTSGAWPIDMYGNSDVANFLANFGSNSISTSGTVTINGTDSNLIRKSSQITQSDIALYMDNIIATVGDTPKRLRVRSVYGNLTVTGSGVTYTGGNVSVGNWTNVTLVIDAWTDVADAISNDGDNTVLTITSTSTNEAYRVTAMQVSGEFNRYTTVIERLA